MRRRLMIKSIVERIPVVGPAARSAAQAVLARGDRKIRDSGEYWEKRYRAGGNSGSGSYNHLAQFKADFLNDFVRRRGVTSVLELGCGDGAQLGLAEYPCYTGADVAPAAVEMCRSRFAQDGTKQFLLTGELPADLTADLTMSLDVIYHLIEDEVFEQYMSDLFDRAERFVVVYSSDVDEAIPARHVRHRQFSRWISENRPDWRQVEKVANPYRYDPKRPSETSFADFFVYEAPGR